MKILEVRDGFIKFESEKQISLTSFIQVNGTEKRYVAQVVQVKRSGESQIGYAKILFLYDGSLQPYDKTLPSKESEIVEFTFDIINKSLDSPQPIIVGKFLDNDINIPMDKGCFNKKLLISSDNSSTLKTIITNLKKQFLNVGNVVVIDMLGNIDMQKSVAGVDFKLPLNTESLAFMYEDCLNDATADSKALIKEIFQDLSNYSKSVPFLPFKALKSIVDDMVEKSHVFKLLVLKNKLAKFDKQGYFAGNVSEAENLKKILSQKTSVIDLSKLDAIFQNRYFEVIFSLLEKSEIPVQVFVNVSNTINKKNLKNIIKNENVSSVFVTHSKFKYINEIKTMFDNFIIEPSFSNNEIFKVYSMFLNSMPKGTFLVVGEGTNYIPLISSIKEFEVLVEQKVQQDVQESLVEEQGPVEEDLSDEVIEIELNPDVESNAVVKVDVELETVVDSSEIEQKKITEAERFESIDKKSDELIERITEEVVSESNTLEQIFVKEEDDVGVSVDEEGISEENSEETLEEILNEPEVQTVEQNLEEEIVIENNSESEIINSQDNDELVIEDALEKESVLVDEDSLIEEDLSVNTDLEESVEEVLVEESLDEEIESFHSDSIIEENVLEQNDVSEIIEVSDEISDMAEEAESYEMLSDFESQENEFVLKEENSAIEAFDSPELEVLPVNQDEDFSSSFDEVVELDESEYQEGDIVVELDQEEPVELSESELLDKEIVEDVDKVFTTMREDSISDSDLDFIDELNEETALEEELGADDLQELSETSSIEELPEYSSEEDSEEGFLEPLEEISELSSSQEDEEKEFLETRKGSTPNVPLYEAEIPQEDIVVSDVINQGDSVHHAKYGNGVVEKMIKYGTKTLYSINFDNIGRRLLDPTLTEIKKI